VNRPWQGSARHAGCLLIISAIAARRNRPSLLRPVPRSRVRCVECIAAALRAVWAIRILLA
ncbi:hypothetical protein, partial [Xanthomonas graminis]|uniref:hypothetical protein n=1 Tax=Xanthomonas graminis TaxID=3390026 RepID=UPI001C4A0405